MTAKSKCDTAAISSTAIIAHNVVMDKKSAIGPFSVVGVESGGKTIIGEEVQIGSHVVIEDDVIIGKGCFIDAYCRVCSGSIIGNYTQILYGAAIFENVRIGEKCVIGGNVADRTLIEDYVTYFGEIAHDYRIPGDIEDWDNKVRPSPIIRARSVVGQNALLLGGIEIGKEAYVAAGEIVRCNVPSGHILAKGRLRKLSELSGLIQTRSDR